MTISNRRVDVRASFKIIPGLPQLFALRDSEKNLVLIVAKVVDDFLLSGSRSALQAFHQQLSKRFDVGRFVLDMPFVFNRLHISRDEDGCLVISMQEFFDTINPIPISRSRCKEAEALCNADELKHFQRLSGKLNYLGHGVLPSASFAASYLQQFVGEFRVKHLSLANAALNELRKLKPTLRYRPVSADLATADFSLLAFSDASQGQRSYGQTGYLSGIFFDFPDRDSIYHVIDWYSGKQSRVSFSSIGAEILAAAESADRSVLIASGIQDIYSSDSRLPLILTVDSLGLYSTITTLHEGRDYRLRRVASRLRDSFESEEISVMQRIEGNKNLADALTKWNTTIYTILNQVCNMGVISSSSIVGAEERKLKRT